MPTHRIGPRYGQRACHARVLLENKGKNQIKLQAHVPALQSYHRRLK